MHRVYQYNGNVIISGDVFDVTTPINKNTLFELDIFKKKSFMTWEDIERVVAKVWLDYAPDYPRLTGRRDEGNGLKAIEPSAPYAVLMRDLINVTKPFLRDGQHWADLCCGRGRTIDYLLAEKNIKISAVDRFSVLAPHLQQDQRVTWFEQDLVQYLRDVGSESLDGIVSNMGWPYAMSHTTSDGKMFIGRKAAMLHLESIFRSLKHGAPFISSVPRRNVNFTKVLIAGQPYLWQFWKWISERNFRPWSGFLVLGHAKKLARLGKAGLFHFYNESELSAMLKEVGFVDISCKVSFAGQDLVFKAVKP